MEEQMLENYDSFTPNKKYLKKNYTISLITLLIIILFFGFWGFVVSFNSFTNANTSFSTYLKIALLVITLFFVFFGTLLLYFIRLQYRALHYQVTKTEILIKSGVIFKKQVMIPLRTITNIDMIIGPIDRIYGIGTVNIQTAGSVSFFAEGRFVGLLQNDAEKLRDHLKNQLYDVKGSPGTAIDNFENIPDDSDVELVLKELRSIRAAIEEIRDRKG